MSEQDSEEKKVVVLHQNDDGFEGYVDEYVNPPEQVSASIIVGTRLKYSNDGRWLDNENKPINTSQELIATKLLRVIQKWSPENLPLETKILAPNEPWPDIDAENDACPRNEWRQDFNGNPVGPWQAQRVCYLMHEISMKKFTYATATIGGQRAISELANNVAWRRKRVNAGATPIIKLDSIFMPTRYGGRMAPSLTIVRWLGPSGGGGQSIGVTAPPTALPPQKAAALPSQSAAQGNPATSAGEILPPLSSAATPKPARSSKPKSGISPTVGLQPIEQPTVKQDLQDEVPW
jgi:hypothetical protein